MSKQLERARAKHQEAVKQHMRMLQKRDEYLGKLTRLQGKLGASERAMARSQKRLDKLMVGALHNCGPTATPVENLVGAVAGKIASPVTPDEYLGF
jgi:hypothetical protein